MNLDIAAEDLRQRLREGKIYPADKIERSLANFFTEENLTTLRELALREVASSVDRAREAIARRESAGADRPRAKGTAVDRVLVAMSSNPPYTATLLRKASRIAGRLNSDWYCVYVQTPEERADRIDTAVQRKLVDNIQMAQRHGRRGGEARRRRRRGGAGAVRRAQRRHAHHRRTIATLGLGAFSPRVGDGVPAAQPGRYRHPDRVAQRHARRTVRVGQRLYLAVLPAVLGILLVAALAYWGQFANEVPEVVLVIAALAAVLSLIFSWRNTRYVAQRIQRLAEGSPRRHRATDELETIERVVDTLSSEVSVAREAGAETERAASARVSEYANLLAETSAGVARRLDEVRLPLHILLENHFGELNENQEEMLAAARQATEDAEGELQKLREIAQLDRGALALRRDSIRLKDLLTSLLPTLRARAERERVQLDLNIAPALPRVLGDPARLREALSLLLGHRVEHTPPGETVRIDVEHDRKRIRLTVNHAPLPALGAEELLARRLTEAHGGRIETSGGRTEITLPVHAVTGETRVVT